MKNRYVLTGGLGNQLFQYAAAISLEPKKEIQFELERCLGKPRSTNGIPDLEYFDLQGTQLRNTWSSFLNRALGLSLRINLFQSNRRELHFFKRITTTGISIFGSIILNRPVRIISPNDLGWDPNFRVSYARRLIIGYFQSHKYVTSGPTTLKRFQDLKLKSESPLVLKYRELSLLQSPLVVHVRRGDYVNESSFGILSSEYYRDIIKSVYASGHYNKIWLFSDDFVEAAMCIPEELRNEVLEIPEVDNSPASTLQVMRFGKGYVIANSSFSWWGAFLSENRNCEVHAPFPWFRGMPSPNEILPPSWIPHESNFS